MPQPLPRFHREQQALDMQRIERIVAETAEPTSSASATSGGDARRLRGLPAISRHTQSAMPGSDPLRALLWKERQRTLGA